ncbi:MAG: hypothetical protein O2968_23570 [Acidobacteria bacterium]|nr:hypothetical protein [Acidobacteriota bacterium]
MKNAEHDPRLLEECLRGYRVAAPSPELKARVLGAARAAWNVAPLADNIPSIWPIVRLAACLVAAAIPVFLAHTADSPSGARSGVLERESADVRATADLWAMTGRSQIARLQRRTAAMREPDGADLLAGHLRALSAELPPHRTNGG